MSNKTTVTAEPNSPILKVERIFDAPRSKVFEAHVKKDMLEKWWSPWGETQIEIDAREGGSWKFTDVQSDGPDVVFHGIYHEVNAPTRIVQTEEFAGLPERGHVVLDKYEFNELGDSRTAVILTSAFLSVEDRDAAVQTGMEKGILQQHDNLDALLGEK